jgi:hypothetical protein
MSVTVEMVLTSTGGGTGGLAITTPEAINTNARVAIAIRFIIFSPYPFPTLNKTDENN